MKKNNLFEGMKFGLGVFLILSIIGAVYAVGFHYASEILPGTFSSGNFSFDGSVGIGTNSLGAMLDVNGNITLEAGAVVNEFSTDGTLTGNSDLAVPTEKAVKTYVDAAASGPSGWNCTVRYNSVLGSSYQTVIAYCSGDEKAISGGCETNLAATLYANIPGDQGWVCKAYHGASSVTLYAYVNCCS